MSMVMVAPEVLSAAAEDIAGVGSVIAEANTTAAAPTVGVVAPAADSVSAELAALFGRHAQTYQAVSAQAQVFHQDFVHTLAASGTRYAHAEQANATRLGAGHTPDGLRLLGSRQHPSANPASRLWRPQHLGLWRPGMGSSGLIHPITAPRLLTPHTGLIRGALHDPRFPLIHQIITNQIGYVKTVITSLENFVKDELHAILGLPAAFEQAVKDLLHGNLKGAMSDIEKGFLKFLVNGATKVINNQGWYEVAFTGPLADLAPMWRIPAQQMQNLADLLKPIGFGIMGNLVQQHLATPLENLTSGWHMYLANSLEPGFRLDKNLALLLDVLGAPILSLEAFQDSIQSTFDAIVGGHLLRAGLDFLTTPASIMHAFLFGEGYLHLPGIVSDTGTWIQGAAHLGGIFAPLGYGQASLHACIPEDYSFIPVTNPSRGTLTGGLVPALVSMLPPKLQVPLFGLGSFLDGIIATLEGHSARP
ncbi:PE family protein [Mycobacterium haemophilum]|uniref:PE family protein n=1 Tax=Mycobacterium haemophilum TaxID=29311 RepID=UPI000699E4F7|nr:PE family protein [Mycobacterium haemophilum]